MTWVDVGVFFLVVLLLPFVIGALHRLWDWLIERDYRRAMERSRRG